MSTLEYPDSKKIIIAVDGHSSCGKSTLAKQLAQELGYIHIDTGAMYRAVTLHLIKHDVTLSDEDAVKSKLDGLTISFEYQKEGNATLLNGVNVSDDIRTPSVANKVSEVAALSVVRAFLLDTQRDLGKQKGIIMDGRDIGTVIFPDAELKLFVTASVEVRSERRHKELTHKGTDISFDDVKANLIKRDFIDENRDIAPLKRADDAMLLDTSDMTRAEQLAAAIALVETCLNK